MPPQAPLATPRPARGSSSSRRCPPRAASRFLSLVPGKRPRSTAGARHSPAPVSSGDLQGTCTLGHGLCPSAVSRSLRHWTRAAGPWPSFGVTSQLTPPPPNGAVLSASSFSRRPGLHSLPFPYPQAPASQNVSGLSHLPAGYNNVRVEFARCVRRDSTSQQVTAPGSAMNAGVLTRAGAPQPQRATK